MQIKICGITNLEDALHAAQCGAEALGFIFYRPSPRYIDPPEVEKIIKKLPAGIVTVGVFVNEAAAEVKRISDLCNLDFIQLHGDESVEYCRSFSPQMIIKAIDLQNDADLEKALSYDVAAILVDSRHAGLYGGTGQKSNWEMALKLRKKKALILSGGISEENIVEAWKTVNPAAFDICSSVEIKPGKKDHKKVERIFDLIRSVAITSKVDQPIFIKRKV